METKVFKSCSTQVAPDKGFHVISKVYVRPVHLRNGLRFHARNKFQRCEWKRRAGRMYFALKFYGNILIHLKSINGSGTNVRQQEMEDVGGVGGRPELTQ